MAAKIIKTYTESFPAMRLIGRLYTEADRTNGSFGEKWGEWFGKNLFAPLKEMGPIPQNGDAYLGAMRIVNGNFEYWIGMFFPANTVPPEGYASVDIEPLDFAICWIYGNEQNGEIYGLDSHNACVEEAKKHNFIRKDDNWCFERYNCPRFTTPDEKGNVILDYGFAVE